MEKHNSVIMSTIEKGDIVLITGVSGFIASHTALQFLEAGYKVRGTVRSKDKADWLCQLSDEKYGKGKFEAFVVPDMMVEAAFDEAVKGVSGICHMASVVTFSDKFEEVIPPVVKGALNIMTAATKEPSIKSLVYTSSSTAALMPQPDQVIKVGKDTWDDDVVKKANGPDPSSWDLYGASKTEAEQAIWTAVRETNPPFQVATILPNANLGPIIKPGGEDSSSTASWVLKVFKGEDPDPNFPPQYFVDVRDTARLHVIALIDPSCNGHRLFAFAAPFNWNDVLAIFRKQNPSKTFAQDIEGLGRDLSEIPNDDAEALLKKHYGKGFTSLEEVLEANTAILK